MSENRNSIIVIVLLVLSLIGLFAWLGTGRRNWNWNTETYKADDKDPYGTYILHRLLEKKPNGLERREAKAIPTDVRGVNYVFVGEACYLDSADVLKMRDFVRNGNTMFVASSVVPYLFYKEIYGDICNSFSSKAFEYENWDARYVNLALNHPNFKENDEISLVKMYSALDTAYNYNWEYLTTETNCDAFSSRFIPLGTANGRVNFAKIKYGEGEIYFYTTPLALTNWSLTEEKRLRYAAKIFSHLNPNGKIYWDEKSRVAKAVGKNLNRRNRRNGNERDRNGNEDLDERSPLQYVLSQPSLTWAWYILLSGLAFYMLFRAKRRQRIIPVLAKKTNTSLEFVKNIGRMYFLQSDYVGVTQLKIRQFQTFVRERYRINSKDMNEEFIQAVVQRADVPEKLVRSIVQIGAQIYGRQGVSESDMVNLHHWIQTFYKKCK